MEMKHATLRIVVLSLLLVTFSAMELQAAPFNVLDVNPDTGAGDPILGGGRNTSSGGRVNNLAIDPADADVLYAASEWGGLWKTLDGGNNWFRLEDHKPFATWDIAIDPGNTGNVYATSFYDGRTNSLAGISVSTDGGATWTHPATSIPPVAQCSAQRRSEPSAFGISIDPLAPTNVYIGTNCGLAISTDSGQTWNHVTPSGVGSRNIRDVIAHNNGTIDVCGQDGHFRSTDGGATWTAGTGLPGGACSITVSPLEANVLHATASNQLWESRDGANWNLLAALSGNRPRWVVDGPASGSSFTMYYGDGVKLRTVACDNTSTPRCPAAGPGGDTDQTGNAHDDVADIEFDALGCPRYVASDGGIYSNSGCPGITWNRAMGRYRALWIFGFGGGEPVAGSQASLHIGMQDNGYFSSADGGVNWQGNECCDGFDNLADSARTVYSICCFSPAPSTRFFVADADNPQNNQGSFNPPSGSVRSFAQLDSIDQFGPQSYVMTTSDGVFFTMDEGSTWSQLGNNPNACGVVVSRSSTGSVTFYAKTGDCNGGGGGLLKYSGTATGGTWTAADNGLSSVGIFDVDPFDPNHLRAADLASPPRMVVSTDGGATWQPDTTLDLMMTGNGLFKYTNTRGPTNFTGFNGYSQPTLLAFSPHNADMIFAGGADSGLFASTNNGASWIHLADDVPRPYHAFFSAFEDATYIGTQGRGIFKVSLANADLRITKSDSPDPVHAGDQLYYTLTVRNLGPDNAEEVVVIDQLPEEVTFITDDAGVCVEIATGELHCDLGNIASSTQRSITIKVKVDPDVLVAAGNVEAIGISNTASVSGRVNDPDLSNNEVTASTLVEDSADLNVVKICKPDGPLDAGETGFCEILVDNLGISDARDVEIIDRLTGSGNFSIDSVSASGGVGTICSPLTGSGSNAYNVSCNATSLAAGARITITIDVTATDQTDINDVVTVSAATPDPDFANNEYEGSISVNALADMEITKSAPGSVVAGNTLVYTLQADNLGPSAAENVVISDNLPAGVQVVSVPSTCNAGVPGDPFQPTTCTLGTINSGAGATVAITVLVLPDRRGILLNDARVSSSTTDRNNANNSANTSTGVTSEADLQISKTDVQDPVIAGEILDYELQIVNDGPSSAFNLIVRDELPPEVSFSGAVLQDVDGSCALLDPPASNVLECHIGELWPDTTTPAFINIKTLVRADTPAGQISNNASVESTDTTETNPANNSVTELTTVETMADVGVDKSTPFDTYKPSSQIIYTINTTNLGPSDAQNVVVTDTLPLDSKKTPYLIDTGGCDYDEPSHQVTCQLGTLPAQETVSFNIHMRTKGNLGTITNTVEATTDTMDPEPSNNLFALPNLVAGGVKEQSQASGELPGTLVVTDMSVATSCDLRDLKVTFSWLPEQASPIAQQAVQVSLFPNEWNARAFGVSHMPAHANGQQGEATISNLQTATVYYWRVVGRNAASGVQEFETPFCVADLR